ncbi:DASH family cryptochrome [Gaetbulibacter aestuarii]|uniref:Cryptochrome DASH n=1 Tax=Gaetbulibacter aestuarii TaxID=1502358 RepID=A0ABW7MZ21_9FLAO
MQTKQDNIGLVWFRNDLRTQDQAALKQALENHTSILALYCFDPRHFEDTIFGFKKTEKYRAKFLIETVQNLKKGLKDLNIELFVFYDRPEIKIPDLIKSYNIKGIYAQKEWTQEEKAVEDALVSNVGESVKLLTYYDQFLFHPDDIPLAFSQIPQVFTVFRKKLEKEASVRPEQITKATEAISDIRNDTEIPSLEDLGFESFETHPNSAFPFQGGEEAAEKRLQNYFFKTKKLGVYKKTRNGLVGTNYSSKFSAWLANGSISPRHIYWQIKAFEKEHFKNQSTYWLIFELIWRDYFKYISLKHGDTIFYLGGILNKNYSWRTNESDIKAWIEGRTSSDFVNANMIELAETGWMSNRGRQNVASYFAKDLELDWRIGAAYFESLLMDYDVHSNYGNWMYVSGVGNDPRDRKFNVKLQAERYDPQGKFQNLWLQKTLF